MIFFKYTLSVFLLISIICTGVKDYNVKYMKILKLKEYEKIIKIRTKLIIRSMSRNQKRTMLLLGGDLERNPGKSYIMFCFFYVFTSPMISHHPIVT